jgi:hypothetical protein
MKTKIKISMVMVALLSSIALGEKAHDSFFGKRLSKPVELAYGGPRLKMIQIKDDSGIVYGGGGAHVYKNKKYLIGGEGYGGQIGNYNVLFGGMMVGRIFNPEKRINYTIKTRLGGGLIAGNSENSFYLNIEPQVDLNLNIHSNIKGFLGIGLPYSFNLDMDNLNKDELNHLSFIVGLKFEEY